MTLLERFPWVGNNLPGKVTRGEKGREGMKTRKMGLRFGGCYGSESDSA